jgi:hypothetical protein
MFYNIINNNKILFLYIKKHTNISVVLMDDYRGIKASELVKQLKTYINKFGDLYVFKEKNGNIYPVHFINHFPNTDYFELT